MQVTRLNVEISKDLREKLRQYLPWGNVKPFITRLILLSIDYAEKHGESSLLRISTGELNPFEGEKK